MKKIDRRKSYYLMIDTETANGLDNPLMYDIGGAIIDKKGKILESFSFVIYEIYILEKSLMDTCYYNDKLPKYEEDLKNGTRKLVTLRTARNHIHKICKDYKVKAIVAHNMRFDYKSTSDTSRYVTKSACRFFLPYGIPVWCTLTMARDTIAKQKSYRLYCENNGFITSRNQVRLTAEILYKYMSGNKDFKEEHTGLEDVKIETQIFAWILRQHKKMRKSPYKDRTIPDSEKLARGWEL